MHLISPRQFTDAREKNTPFLSTPGWEQGSFVLNQLIEGCLDLRITPTVALPMECTTQRNRITQISPLGINFHLNAENAKADVPLLLDLMLTELSYSASQWEHRTLGDLYWNRYLIEYLDEGSLTELAFNLASKLKRSHQSYQHTAELSLSDDSLNKLALLRGLGVNRIVFSLPFLCQPNPQLASHIHTACNQAQELGYTDISLRLTYDSDKVGARELLGLFLDLPQLGPHRLYLSPICRSGNRISSLWESQSATYASSSLLCRARKWLVSQGYQASSYDCFIFGLSDFNSDSGSPVYFSPTGQLSGCSADFIGIGPGAFSRMGVYKAVNQKNLATYSGHLSRGEYPRQNCKKLNSYFLSIERPLIQFLKTLTINLQEPKALLGKARIQKVKSQIERLPSIQYSLDTDGNLTLQEQARDWLPLICTWLVQRQPGQAENSIISC